VFQSKRIAPIVPLIGLLVFQTPGRAQIPKFGPAPAPGVVTHYVTKGDNVISSHTIDLNEEVRLIVEFKTPPLSTLASKRKPLVAPFQRTDLLSAVQSEHSRLRTDLAAIDALGSSNSNAVRRSGTTRILREYQTAINAAAITTRRWAMSELTKLPYVKRIAEDKPVKGDDIDVNHQIGADSVALDLGLAGAGVRIGLVDSGVDYNTTELGAGIGPGHTIVGGYDFVKDAPDPMDENGHGTEVCTIIVRKSDGVAPGVSVYAYKVLNQDAEGTTSNVIAGIERALDPDNDPLTSDAVDIINLSLGGPDSGNSPLNEAVDNATKAGVLCVVSAGNSGSHYQTIGSPGCVESALTVGACDKADAMAGFSSRGPTNTTFLIKPDVVAPGVNISTMRLGEGTYLMSGTSASAPVVTGAAALLKQLHPSWTPALLKSALMGTAKDLSAELWEQGKGRIDVLRATRESLLVVPQSLSMGLDELSQTTWTRVDTLTVYNYSDSTQSFAVQFTGSLPAGVTVSLSRASLQVPQASSGEVYVTTIVDNTVATISTSTPPAINGRIVFQTGSRVMEVPWALAIGAYVDLSVSTSLYLDEVDLTRYGGDYTVSVRDLNWYNGTYVKRQLIEPGVYEAVTWMSKLWKDYWVVKDSLPVNPFAQMVASDSQAVFQVGTPLRDENGNTLDSSIGLFWGDRIYSNHTRLSYGTGGNQGSPAGMTDGITDVSPLSGDYVFDYYYLSDVNFPKFYSYSGSYSSITENHVVDLHSGDLMLHTIDFRVPDTVQSMKFIQFLNFSWELSALGTYSANGPILASPRHQQWYSTGQPTSNFPKGGYLFNFQVGFTAHGTPFDPGSEMQLFGLPNRFLGNDGIVRQTLSFSDSAVMEIKHQGIVYGLGPRHYFGRMENTPLRLKAKYNTKIGFGATLFYNQLFDQTYPENLLYRLRDDHGNLLGSGLASTLLTQEQYQNTGYLDQFLGVNLLASGRYTLELIDTNSVVATRQGTARVLLTSDTRLADPNPPAMIAFSILADTVYTDTISQGKAATIEFQITDDVALSQVTLFYQLENDTLWHSIPIQLNGNIYSGKTPSISSPVFVTLRLVATDASGNTLDYRADPAFHVGPYSDRPPVASKPLYPGNGDTLSLYTQAQKIVFHWAKSHDPDSWDSISYHVRAMGPGLGRGLNEPTKDTSMTFFIMSYLVPDTTYYWWVESSDGQITVSSDTAHFRTSDTLLAVQGESDIPKEYALYQNYPNPFNPTTTIRYDVPKESHVVLKVYNVLGQEVVTLKDAEQRAGRYEVLLDGKNLASGIYFYRLQAGSFVESKKLLLIR